MGGNWTATYPRPGVQCWEKDIGTPEAVLPSIESSAPLLDEAQRQMDHAREQLALTKVRPGITPRRRGL
jgi:hypothetical protein